MVDTRMTWRATSALQRLAAGRFCVRPFGSSAEGAAQCDLNPFRKRGEIRFAIE